MASKLLVLLAILCVSFLILDFTFWRDGKVAIDPYGCKHLCEWQLAKMNETFDTLITVCEKKLRQLHDSDMNLAIIREQLHKEILELFSYEFQTFQQLHSTRIESVPQFCLEYCTVVDSAKHREYKENMTNSHYQIQRLIQRQRWLRIHMRRRLQLVGGNVNYAEPETLSVAMLCSHSLAMVIVIVALFVIIIRPTRNRLALLIGEKERMKTQLHVAQTQLMQVQAASISSLSEESKEPHLDNDNQRLEFSASDEEVIIGIVERNSFLESWNDELLRCERQLNLRLADVCSEKDLLSQENKETIALKDKSLKNIDKFWHQWLNEERRKARKTAEEKEAASVEMIKAIESKHQWKLAKEITRYQISIQELENKLKLAQERDAEGEQIMLKKQDELEGKVRKLERDTKILQLELVSSKMDLSVETEGKNRALAHVSDLEGEVTRLRIQAARLVEGCLKNDPKNSRRMNHHHAQSAQLESSSLRMIDSRLQDIRQDFESRFVQLQSKFDDQVTRDSEELRLLRLEHQKLCESLELANKRNVQLERRLAYQEPIQPLYRSNVSERSSRTPRWVSPRQRLPRQRSSSIDRFGIAMFLTQPVSDSISYQDLTDYLDYDYLCSC